MHKCTQGGVISGMAVLEIFNGVCFRIFIIQNPYSITGFMCSKHFDYI